MRVKLTEKGRRLVETLELPKEVRDIFEDLFGPDIKTLTVPEPEVHSMGENISIG